MSGRISVVFAPRSSLWRISNPAQPIESKVKPEGFAGLRGQLRFQTHSKLVEHITAALTSIKTPQAKFNHHPSISSVASGTQIVKQLHGPAPRDR